MRTNLQPDIIRYLSVFYKTPYESKVGVASGRVSDLDFFDAALYEGSEEHGFLWDGHRVCEGLVAITEISR
jgi:hypothetical protein